MEEKCIDPTLRKAELQRAALEAVREEDVQAIIRALMAKAKGGNVQAAKELLTRVLPKPKVQCSERGPEEEPFVPAEIIAEVEAERAACGEE